MKKERVMKTMKRASGTIRKRQIKAAALDILSAEGVKNLSTKNLASHVHLSEGTIFRHFHSKNEILFSILEDVENLLVTKLRKIASEASPAPERLHKFICFHLKYLFENHGVTILLFSEAACQNNSELKTQLNRIFLLIRQSFEEIIKEGQKAGWWNGSLSSHHVSSLYMGIPVSMNIEMYLSGNTFGYETFCEGISHLVLLLLTSSDKKMAFFEKNEIR